jgi:hypothetical protein
LITGTQGSRILELSSQIAAKIEMSASQIGERGAWERERRGECRCSLGPEDGEVGEDRDVGEGAVARSGKVAAGVSSVDGDAAAGSLLYGDGDVAAGSLLCGDGDAAAGLLCGGRLPPLQGRRRGAMAAAVAVSGSMCVRKCGRPGRRRGAWRLNPKHGYA